MRYSNTRTPDAREAPWVGERECGYPRYEYVCRSIEPVLRPKFLDKYAVICAGAMTISLGCSGHYRDLGISSRKRHDSVCNLILSVASGKRANKPVDSARHRRPSSQLRSPCPHTHRTTDRRTPISANSAGSVALCALRQGRLRGADTAGTVSSSQVNPDLLYKQDYKCVVRMNARACHVMAI